MDNALKAAVEEALEKKKQVNIQYYSDIHEFLTVTALIKKVEEKEGQLTLELASGLEIPFNRLVRVDKVAADQYDDGFFQCGL